MKIKPFSFLESEHTSRYKRRGSSWDNPFDNIQDAFDASAANAGGSVVVCFEGNSFCETVTNAGDGTVYFVDNPDSRLVFWELDEDAE